MKWTTDKPTKPGWYWWRDGFEELIIKVVERAGGLYVEWRGKMDHHYLLIAKVEEARGEWAGPLEPPNDIEYVCVHMFRSISGNPPKSVCVECGLLTDVHFWGNLTLEPPP